jgi:protein-glutamine gamma-glutamyltransferase
VTGVPGTVGRPDGWSLPRAPGHRKTHRPSRLERVTVPPLALRALPFLALAFFASAHWTALVQPAQTGRAFVASLIATVGGVLIGASARLPRVAGTAVRIVLVLATAVFALTAIGIRFKLLMPAGWGTLGDRITGGLSVIGSVSEWPYAGPNVWLRLTTLMAAPLVLTIAAGLAFWPRARAGRTAALVLLVTLYAIAVAARPLGDQGLRGVGLLACLAAWFWLPRLKGRDAAAAVTAIAAAALVALIVTPKLASSDPWVDYRHWSWTFHKEQTIGFDWRQNYGPLHWPRKGTTLLLIRSKHAHYWKAETLDRFDGRGWTTTSPLDSDPTAGIAGVTADAKWVETVHVTVRSLRSDVLVAPGSVFQVTGLDNPAVPLTNEVAIVNGQLAPGDTYTVRTYAPDPTAKQMRAAPPPDPAFVRYTTLDVPRANGAEALVQVPLDREPRTGDRGAVQELQQSRYSRIYDLARSIVSKARTQYDMISAVGAYLEGHFAYSEKVPQHTYPLDAFLFTDKRGYCQQFAGSAALMLRMLGIPTRVVTGFAPGTLNRDTHEYVVRDLDAHAWIEVWFEGIGWVPFDPTPAQAPASSRAASFGPFSEVASAARGITTDRRPPKRELSTLGKPGGAGGAATSTSGGKTPWGWIITGCIIALLALAALVITLVRIRSKRSAAPRASGDPELDHLVRLLWRLGLEIPPTATLLELERRLYRLGGDDAAAYAERLRRRRFGAGTVPPPGRAERRRLRQVLAKAVDAGPLARLYLAMPDNWRGRLGIRGPARPEPSN